MISSHSSNDEGSQSSSSEKVDLAEIAHEFVVIMQGGMKLLAATSIGSTRAVTVITDGINLTWVSVFIKLCMYILVSEFCIHADHFQHPSNQHVHMYVFLFTTRAYRGLSL